MPYKYRYHKQKYNRQYRIRHRKKLIGYSKKYYYANKEKLLSWGKKYHQQHREKRVQYLRKYYRKNRKRLLRFQHKKYLANIEFRCAVSRRNHWKNRKTNNLKSFLYRRKNLLKILLQDRKRSKIYYQKHKIENQLRTIKYKARKIKLGGFFSSHAWKELKMQQNNQCLCCKQQEPKIKLTIDHVIPSTKWRKWKKGNPRINYKYNDIQNIQGLCGSCNTAKSDRLNYKHLH